MAICEAYLAGDASQTLTVYSFMKEGERTKMKKKMLTFSLAAFMLAGSVFSVSAAGVKDVLSSDYYAGKYSDLKAAYGTNKDAYVAHFLTSGAKEGRVMNPILDVVAYSKAYADLNAAFGEDWDAYVNHYLTTGIKERRTTGVMFDLVDYADKNPDLKAAYGDDYVALAYQYVTSGINEGRPGGVIAEEVEEAEEAEDNGSNDSNNSGGSTQTPKPEEPAPAPGHNHTNDKTKADMIGIVNPLNCTTDGYVQYRCNEKILVNGNLVQCSYTWRESIEAKHSMIEGDENVYLLHPNCTESGVVKYTCAVCGDSITETVDALGHDFKTDKVTATPSTGCREEDRGKVVTTTKCTRCGVAGETTTKLADPLPHKFSGASHVSVKPTCTTWGENYGYCDFCAEKVTVKVPPVGHNDKDEVVTVYADTYLQGDAAHSHYAYDIKYCRTCNVITWVDPDAEYTADAVVVCADANKDGACDDCGLPMKRQVTAQVKIYKENESFIGTVQ